MNEHTLRRLYASGMDQFMSEMKEFKNRSLLPYKRHMYKAKETYSRPV